MTMTKTLTMSWILPNDPKDKNMSVVEADLKIVEMLFDGKTEPEYRAVLINKNTKQRRWRDQAAVDEWIEFMNYIAKKYNCTVVVGEVKDI